jgi:hypothetical protein
MSVGPYLNSTILSGYVRYGNWTGRGYSALTLSPAFIALTLQQKAVPGSDAFDAVSRLHDIAYDNAQESLLLNLASGSSGSSVMLQYLTQIRQADLNFAAAASDVTAANTWGATVQEIGITVMSAKADWEEAAIERIQQDPAYAASLNDLLTQNPGSIQKALTDISGFDAANATADSVAAFENKLDSDCPFLAATSDVNVLQAALVENPALAPEALAVAGDFGLFASVGSTASYVISEAQLKQPSWDDFYAQSLQTAANEIITQFLAKAGLPANWAAQAASVISISWIKSQITGTQSFNADVYDTGLAMVLNKAVGALASYDHVSTLFSAIGLPKELASLTGAAFNTALSQQLTLYVAKDVLGLSSNALASAGLTGSVSFSSFVSSLGTAFVNAGFALAGQKLALAIFPNEGLPTQIGITVGQTIGGALFGPVGGFLGSLIGDLIGDLAGLIFGTGYRGRPLGVATIKDVNGIFVDGGDGVDNKGYAQKAAAMATRDAANRVLNGIAKAIGGTAEMTDWWEVSVTKTTFTSQSHNLLNGTPADKTQDPNQAAANAILHILRETSFSNGNAYMVFALEQDLSTNQSNDEATLKTVLNDLNAAYDWCAFVAAPDATMISLALSGDVSRYNAWLGEVQRSDSLGLSRLDVVGGTLVIQSSAATLAGDLGALSHMRGQAYSLVFSDTAVHLGQILDTLQAQGSHVAAETLTDNGGTMALTVQQYHNDAAALGAVSGTYSLALSGVAASTAATTLAQPHAIRISVSDTGSNVAAGLDALQSYLAAGKLMGIHLTDSTPTLTLTETQVNKDGRALALIADAYTINETNVAAADATSISQQARLATYSVSDSGGNISANLVALEKLAAASMTTISLTNIYLLAGLMFVKQPNGSSTQVTPQLKGITDTDHTLITASVAGLSADKDALALIQGNPGLAVADTGSTIWANLASLGSNKNVTAISVTDGSTLTFAPSQAAQYGAAIAKFTGINTVITADANTSETISGISASGHHTLSFINETQGVIVNEQNGTVVTIEATQKQVPIKIILGLGYIGIPKPQYTTVYTTYTDHIQGQQPDVIVGPAAYASTFTLASNQVAEGGAGSTYNMAANDTVMGAASALNNSSITGLLASDGFQIDIRDLNFSATVEKFVGNSAGGGTLTISDRSGHSDTFALNIIGGAKLTAGGFSIEADGRGGVMAYYGTGSRPTMNYG